MPFVKKVTHQLLGPAFPKIPKSEEKEEKNTALFIGARLTASTALRQLGSYRKMAEDQASLTYGEEDSPCYNLPYNEYEIYAPVIGKTKRYLGNLKAKIPDLDRDEAARTVSDLSKKISDPSSITETEWARIKETIEKDPITRLHVISILYDLINAQQKTKILPLAKPIFSQLVKYGAQYDPCTTREDKKDQEKFQNLVKYAFDGEALNLAISKARLGGNPTHYLNYPKTGIDPSFGDFAEIVTCCLPRDADINAIYYHNADYGSYLHRYLGNEFPEAIKLIRFIESKRDPSNPNTQFNYEARDAYGRTPLLLAINICQEDTALALLNLANNKRKAKVGIDIADSNGRAPLLLAAALGMKAVVTALLEKGANPDVLDDEGRGLNDYAQLSEQETAKILAPLVHPYRCNSTFTENSRHSHVYWDDPDRSPLCFYEEDQQEQEGDDQYKHLVILSTHKDYKDRLSRLVHYLESVVKDNGTKENRTLLAYVKQQVDDIKGTTCIIETCLEKQKDVRDYLQTQEAINLMAKNKKIRQLKSYTQATLKSYSPANLITTVRREWCTLPPVKKGSYAGCDVEYLTFEKKEKDLAEKITERLNKANFSARLFPTEKSGAPCVTVNITTSNPTLTPAPSV